MFVSPTTIIVGAGASAEAGLPTGDKLTQQIAELVDLRAEHGRPTKGDSQIHHVIQQLAQLDKWQPNEFYGSGRALAEAMELAPSIDTFLESHRDNREYVLLGKLGIAKAIAVAERESKMAPINDRSESFQLRSLSQTWYASLAQQMFTGIPANQPERAFENLSFIVFNYDRCLEAYLSLAVQRYFRVSRAQAEYIVADARIVHPYGYLGDPFTPTAQVEFAPSEFDLRSVADRIKTYSESIETRSTTQTYFYGAQTLVFLGSAYHTANLNLLDSESRISYEAGFRKRIFATTMGLSKSDESVVREQLSEILTGAPYSVEFGDWIFMNNGTCRELFGAFWRSLTN